LNMVSMLDNDPLVSGGKGHEGNQQHKLEHVEVRKVGFRPW
jgi:hypothetical protein